MCVCAVGVCECDYMEQTKKKIFFVLIVSYNSPPLSVKLEVELGCLQESN